MSASASAFALFLMLDALAPQFSWVSGVASGDQVLAALGVSPPDGHGDRAYGPAVYRGLCDPDSPHSEGCIEYTLIMSGFDPLVRTGRVKLSLAGDRVWKVLPGNDEFYAVPFEYVDCCERGDWGRRRYKAQFEDRNREWHKYCPTGNVYNLFFPKHRKPDVDIPDEWTRFGLGGYPLRPAYVRDARYDLIPTGGQTATLVHAYKGTLYVSEERVLKPPKGSNEKQVPIPPRGLRTGKLPGAFGDQDFTAYRVGGDYYLIPADGTLYRAAPAGAAGLDVTPVWADPNRRLTGCVQLNDERAAVAFGPAAGPGGRERFYLAVGPDPKPVRYARPAARPGDRADAYHEVRDCVAAVRRAKP